jgi:hypothetical protein
MAGDAGFFQGGPLIAKPAAVFSCGSEKVEPPVVKLMLVSLVLLLVSDDGRYASSPLKPWFESLRNGWGQLCCALADGIEVVDGDWDAHDGHYRVHLASGWTVVPDQAVVPGPTTKRSCGCGTKKL